MLRMLVAAIVFIVYCSKLSAQPLEVVAVDYPYFTEEKNPPEHGVAFKLLRQALGDSAVKVTPQFYPPARAHQIIQSGNWCASFYPATAVTQQYVLIALSDEPIQLGLYRKTKAGAFEWQQLTELAGKKVAYLRALSREGIGKQLQQAGVILFNVETIHQGMKLLEKDRVDYAFGDKYSGLTFFQSQRVSPSDYQFSDSYLRRLSVGVWLNRDCAQAESVLTELLQRGFQHASQ